MSLWLQKYKTKYYITIPILGLIILSDRIFLNKYAIHKTHDGFDSYIPYMNQMIESSSLIENIFNNYIVILKKQNEER